MPLVLELLIAIGSSPCSMMKPQCRAPSNFSQKMSVPGSNVCQLSHSTSNQRLTLSWLLSSPSSMRVILERHTEPISCVSSCRFAIRRIAETKKAQESNPSMVVSTTFPFSSIRKFRNSRQPTEFRRRRINRWCKTGLCVSVISTHRFRSGILLLNYLSTNFLRVNFQPASPKNKSPGQSVFGFISRWPKMFLMG